MLDCFENNLDSKQDVAKKPPTQSWGPSRLNSTVAGKGKISEPNTVISLINVEVRINMEVVQKLPNY